MPDFKQQRKKYKVPKLFALLFDAFVFQWLSTVTDYAHSVDKYLALHTFYTFRHLDNKFNGFIDVSFKMHNTLMIRLIIMIWLFVKHYPKKCHYDVDSIHFSLFFLSLILSAIQSMFPGMHPIRSLGNPTNPPISCNGTFYCLCPAFRPEIIHHTFVGMMLTIGHFNRDTVAFLGHYRNVRIFPKGVIRFWYLRLCFV